MKGSHMFHAGLPPPFPRLSPDQPASALAHQCSPNLPSCRAFPFHSPLMLKTTHVRTRSRTAVHSRQIASQRSWLVHLKVCNMSNYNSSLPTDVAHCHHNKTFYVLSLPCHAIQQCQITIQTGGWFRAILCYGSKEVQCGSPYTSF